MIDRFTKPPLPQVGFAHSPVHLARTRFDDTWPSRYAGGNPFHAQRQDRHRRSVIELHRVDDDFDTGALVTREMGKSIDKADSKVFHG